MAPLYDYACSGCGGVKETLAPIGHDVPFCCGQAMKRKFSLGGLVVKEVGSLWLDRMTEIHKAQSDRGERLRYVHPSEIRAS